MPNEQEESTKQTIEVEVTNDARCFAKAVSRGQQTFTLVEQDRSSPRTIAFWILENIEHAPKPKLRTALEDAMRMREYPHRKQAD